MPSKVEFKECKQPVSALVCGYKGRELHFKHKHYSERSDAQRAMYDRLRAHLAENGMFNPIVTHKGHVLIGQRRFEIMREWVTEIDCLEIITDIYDWPIARVTEITNAVKRCYWKREQERCVSIPKNL